MDVHIGVVRGAKVGAVVICRQSTMFFVPTLTSEDTDEGLLELAAVARVYDRIQAAVEVTQPKYHFKKGLWWT